MTKCFAYSYLVELLFALCSQYVLWVSYSKKMKTYLYIFPFATTILVPESSCFWLYFSSSKFDLVKKKIIISLLHKVGFLTLLPSFIYLLPPYLATRLITKRNMYGNLLWDIFIYTRADIL